ncbi:MAG: hypothetical protein WC867_04165 [Candidatus Pacearchaeota archaeon]|jgi:hypothetical protein
MNYHSSLLSKIALASTLVITSADNLNYSFSQEPSKPKVTQGIESKVEEKKDLEYLSLSGDRLDGNEYRDEYNNYAMELIKTLKEKKRFAPEFKDSLKSYFNPCSFRTTKGLAEYTKKFLLREKDPETYLKEFYKDSEVIEKIKNINEKDYNEFKFNLPWKVDPKNLNLTDQIAIYEIRELLTNPKNLHPMGIGPFSGNPLVR